jgi:coatomer subunit delta
MQLGKKSKATDNYDRVKADLGTTEAEESAPLVPAAPTTTNTAPVASSNRASFEGASPIHITIVESLSAKLSREGTLKSLEIKGDLQLKITDPSLTKLALNLHAVEGPLKAQFRTHPNVDKALFTSNKIIQLKDTTKRFPSNNSIGVLRWRATAPADTADVLPITFTVWVNKSDDSYTITVEYELTSSTLSPLRDVVVTIPYATSEPSVSSFDAMYEVTGDSLEWTIGAIDDSNATGSFEFEAQAEDEAEFFPMSVKFDMSRAFVEVDVLSAKLLEMNEEVNFEKAVKSHSDGFLIE